MQSTHKTPDLTVIFAKIRKAKDASGLTNQELADKSGIPYNSVCTITAGTAKQATLANVAAICAVLGLSLDEIAGLRSALRDICNAPFVQALPSIQPCHARRMPNAHLRA